jgi:hypothetical protein
LHIEGHSEFTTDASVYLRYYEEAEDEEQDAEEEEEDDFDWAKFAKKNKERLAKKTQSLEQKKAWIRILDNSRDSSPMTNNCLFFDLIFD